MNKLLGSLLILAVTIILLTLLLAGNPPLLTIIAVTVILVTLILVLGGKPELLPRVLRVILSETRRILRP